MLALCVCVCLDVHFDIFIGIIYRVEYRIFGCSVALVFNKRLIHYVGKITIVTSYNENSVSGSDIGEIHRHFVHTHRYMCIYIYSYSNIEEMGMPKCQVICVLFADSAPPVRLLSFILDFVCACVGFYFIFLFCSTLSSVRSEAHGKYTSHAILCIIRCFNQIFRMNAHE